MCPRCLQGKLTTDLSSPHLSTSLSPSEMLRWFPPSLQDTVLLPLLSSTHTAICSPPFVSLLLKVLLIFPALTAARLSSPWRSFLLPWSYSFIVSVNFLLFKIFFRKRGLGHCLLLHHPLQSCPPSSTVSPAILQAGGLLGNSAPSFEIHFVFSLLARWRINSSPCSSGGINPKTIKSLSFLLK